MKIFNDFLALSRNISDSRCQKCILHVRRKILRYRKILEKNNISYNFWMLSEHFLVSVFRTDFYNSN